MFTTGGNTTGLISGTGSTGVTSVDVFYSTSPTGTAPNWTACGTDASPTTNTDGTKSWSADCALTSPDTSSQVTAVAAVPNGGAGSGDAARVTGYEQSLQSFTIDPTSDTQSIGFCNTYAVKLRDQNGAPITSAPIGVSVKGTDTAAATADEQDVIKFAENLPVEGTASDPFGPAGAADETAYACDSAGETDGAPDDEDGASALTETVVVAAGAPNTKSISGATQANGNFRFSLALPDTTAGQDAAGTYNISAWLDANGNGTQDAGPPAEPGTTATKTYQAATVNTLDAKPANATNVVGENHTITATVTDQNGNPVGGKAITFRVTSGPNSNNDLDSNNTTPTGVIGQCTTAADGTCSQSYSSTVTGTDSIDVFIDTNSNYTADGGEKSVTVSKTWVQTSNATCIDVEPNDATNPTTAAHAITAHVTDGHMGADGDKAGTFDCTGNPVNNVPVDFTVNAGGPSSTLTPDNNGDAQHERVFTDANGVASVTLHDESATTEGNNTVTGAIPGSGFATITPNFQDISTTGNVVTSGGVSNCDDCVSGQILLPFGFTYAGQTFTSVFASSNGFIRPSDPDGDDGCCSGDSYPDPSAPNGGVIGGFWSDLDTSISGDIRTQTIGVAPNRVFVVQYTNVAFHSGAAGAVTFQIKLFEGSNNIEVHYGQTDVNSHTSSGGVENLDGTGGTQYFRASNADVSNTAVRYTPAAETGRQSETVTKTWAITGKPTDIACTPETDRNLQGEQHTVTCTVTDAFGDGVSGQKVAFRVVSGPNSGNDLDSDPTTTPGFIAEATTGANGVATGTYTGIANPSTTPDTIRAWVDDNGNGGTTTGPDAGDSVTHAALQDEVLKYWTIQANLTNAKIAIDMEPTGNANTPSDVGTANNQKCDANLGANFGKTPANGGDWEAETDDQVNQVERVCVSVKGVDGNIQKGLPVTLTSSGNGVLTNDDGTATGETSQTQPIGDDGYAVFFITADVTGDQTLTATAEHVSGSATGVKHWTSFPARNVTIENVGGDTANAGGTHRLRVTVTDRNGNPVPNQDVTLTETGPGRFTNGPSTEPSRSSSPRVPTAQFWRS